MPSHSRLQPLSRPLRQGATETYPASLAQRRLWFLNQLQPQTAAYNVHVGHWLYGPLDRAALQSSLQEIVGRHDSLRTTFALESGELLQIVSLSPTISLPLKDFSNLSDPYPPAYAFAKQEVETPFDLHTGPLFRSYLMRMAAEEHVLLCTMHHTITDACSLQLFANELAVLYQAHTNGTPPALPELTIQYGDYSEWQRSWLDSEIAEKALKYWKRSLAGAPAVLELPRDASRPVEQSLAGQTKILAVPAEIASGVTSLAKSRRVTPFMVLLAAFKVLLYRYSGQPDVLVGVPVAGRSRVETEPLIGFFVDTVVLRDRLSGNPHFLDLLAQVRETTVNALANADVPFEKVVEALRPERNLSYNPIFQVMFSVIKSAIRSHTFGNIDAYPYVVTPSTSIVDLSATFIEDSDGKWWLQLDFNTSLFNPERIVRMSDDFMEVLRQITSDPEIRIDKVSSPGFAQAEVHATRTAVTESRGTPKRNRRTVPIRHQVLSPAGDTERELLVEIWKDVLGVEEIGVHTNFFDIGGHSLLAARLTAQVQQATGRTIPVSAIFRAPTIATLAELLRDDAVSRKDSLILELREGDSRIPFFAVAAPAVDSLGYALLARHLDDGQSMYKLQGTGPGVWGRPFGKEELRALAREYIGAMRTVQARGPFCLGGMCDGVQIAQEMILQLESEGEEVALFAILDTWVLENSQVRGLWAVDYYLNRIRAFPHLPVGEQLAAMRRIFRRRAERNGSSDQAWLQAYWPNGDFNAPRFHAPVILFKRPRQPFYYVRDPEMGWGERSSAGVEICEVKCRHFEFLRLPHVELIGQKLSPRLREINERVNGHTVSFSESIAAGNENVPLWTTSDVPATEGASHDA
jgi:thioesterase domain-containing protein